jgi:hypothetical protein
MDTVSDKLYLVLYRFPASLKHSDYAMSIGYLPFSHIPQGSKLHNAMLDGSVLSATSEGIRGAYRDLELAKEHLKLEYKLRKGDIDHTRDGVWVWIQCIQLAMSGNPKSALFKTPRTLTYEEIKDD